MAPVLKIPIVAAPVEISVETSDMIVSVFAGRERCVRPYEVTVHNRSNRRIRLMGRRLTIRSGGITERVPFQRNAFAPSVGGEQPLLQSGEIWRFTAAVVTDGFDLPIVTGLFDAIDPDANDRIQIAFPSFDFRASSVLQKADGASALAEHDADILCNALEGYEFSRRNGYGALLQVNRLRFERPESFSIVNRYLIDFFRKNKRKSIEVDFKPIVRDALAGRVCRLLASDHYFESAVNYNIILTVSYVLSYNSWVKRDKPADAGLALMMEKARKKYGLDSVLEELLRPASPEEFAQAQGAIARIQNDRFGSGNLLQLVGANATHPPLEAAHTQIAQDVSATMKRRRNLPAGTPLPPASAKRSGTQRLVSELSPEELADRRRKIRERTARYRAQARMKNPHVTPRVT